MIEGESYTIRFNFKSGDRFTNLNTLIFGLSDSSRQFGEPIQVFDLENSTEENWSAGEFQFIAPTTGRYVTFRLKFGIPTIVHLDNFSIKCPTELNLGNDTLYCEVENIMLEPSGNFEQYTWQDGTTTPTYEVNDVGTYWLEAKRGSCVLRDTISIGEMPFNCKCNVFTATAFSPNSDGFNDSFGPSIPCPVSLYEFTVFNRWGRKIFQSNSPDQKWMGFSEGNFQPPGVYTYLLTYQFTYQKRPRKKIGIVTLVR